MAHSIDLKARVMAFVNEGGSKVDAVRIFKVGRNTIYNWINEEYKQPKERAERRSKIVKRELIMDVEQFPDRFLRERAALFGVCPSAISVALKKLGMRKKNDTLRRKKSQ